MKSHNLFKIFIFCLILAAVLTAGVFGASKYSLNINGESTEFNSSSDIIAVGQNGKEAVGSGSRLYALTADGTEQILLDSAEESPQVTSEVTPSPEVSETPDPDEENEAEKPERVEGGGGGIVSENGSVSVSSSIVKVGLKYYYSKSRNTTLTEARLENSVGSGYEFGYYDENRNFVQVSSTSVTKLSMRIISGTSIGAYNTDTGELLYSVDSTSKSSRLAIRPICNDGEAVTWFKGYRYYGGFEYGVIGGGNITVVNVLPMELYIQGVTASEMNKSWHVEALKAQAVCARTYASRYIMKSSYYYSSGFDLTADTYCQAYTGVTQVGQNIIDAVEATAGICMTYDGQLIDALYMSSDGGSTEDCINVYGTSYDYLAGVSDPYEIYTPVNNAYAKWTVKFTSSQLASISGLSDVVSVEPSYSRTGNIIAITFHSSSGKTSTITKNACRSKMGVNSIHYTIASNGDGTYTLNGGGWGHNVGMSQYGAYAMAAEFNASYKDILGYYYTGISLSNATYLNEPSEQVSSD